MFRVLLESGARSREPRTQWTVASVLTHATLVTLAIAATMNSSAPSTFERERVDPVVYVARREPAEARPGGGGSPTDAVQFAELPSIPVPTLPGFDVPSPQRRDLLTTTDIWRNEPGVGAREPGSAPATGVYTDRLVERPVAPRADNARPVYPSALRASGLEGDVVVRFVVDTAGRVEAGSIVIVRASHSLFADAVRSWLPRTRYTPAEVDGRPVRQLVEQRVGFTLQR
jgi:TonB family protein